MRRIILFLVVAIVMATIMGLGGGLALGEINEKACTKGQAESADVVEEVPSAVEGQKPQCQINTPEAKAGGVV